MSWLLVAILSHTLSASVFLTDKFLISKKSLAPIAYAFYVGVLGFLVVFLIPFDFSIPEKNLIIIALLAGVFFLVANYFFYKSLEFGEVSRIVPLIGGIIPIFTFVFTYIFLGFRFSPIQLFSFIILVIGGLVIIWPFGRGFLKPTRGLVSVKKILITLSASAFFAASFTTTDFVFDNLSFINGLIWTRFGAGLSALFLLILPIVRGNLFKESKELKISTGGILLASKSVSAVAFIFLNYAIFLGPVTLVNALQGIQYVFLFLLAIFLSSKMPNIIKEQISPGTLVQKAIGILLIVSGLAFLAF